MTDRNEMTHEAIELELYLVNSSEYYNQIKAIRANLNKKQVRGVYQQSLARKAWMHVVNRAAKGYAKEFDKAENWFKIFTPVCRREVARSMAIDFEDSLEFGVVYN